MRVIAWLWSKIESQIISSDTQLTEKQTQFDTAAIERNNGIELATQPSTEIISEIPSNPNIVLKFITVASCRIFPMIYWKIKFFGKFNLIECEREWFVGSKTSQKTLAFVKLWSI